MNALANLTDETIINAYAAAGNDLSKPTVVGHFKSASGKSTNLLVVQIIKDAPSAASGQSGLNPFLQAATNVSFKLSGRNSPHLGRTFINVEDKNVLPLGTVITGAKMLIFDTTTEEEAAAATVKWEETKRLKQTKDAQGNVTGTTYYKHQGQQIYRVHTLLPLDSEFTHVVLKVDATPATTQQPVRSVNLGAIPFVQ